jgi:hypothetical protein
MSFRIASCVLLLAACSGTSNTKDGPSNGSALGAPDDQPPAPDCQVTFRFLQKDAYANYAGRTSELWPPHTTTELDVDCGGTMNTYVRENHGSKPTDLAADGQPFLVETKRVGPIGGTNEQVQALVTAYQGCECAPTTTFLSEDVAKSLDTQSLLQSVGAYVAQHLVCDVADPAAVAQDIANLDIADAVAAVSTCQWDTGESWADGFQTAVAVALGDSYTSYHVCNNDAELESALFDSFVAGNVVTACDSDSDICHGPKFFYTP